MKTKYFCPICQIRLIANGPQYSLEEIFKLWAPVQFSKNVKKHHLKQSPNTQMFSCPCCHLDIFYPQIIGTPDFYTEAYQLTKKKTKDIFTYSVDKWEFGEALKDLHKANNILEIGCGPGYFLKKAKKRVTKVFGTEYNMQAAKMAQRNGINILSDKELLKLKGTIDTIFVFHILEHTNNPVNFIKKIAPSLKPGGRISISLPNQDGPIKYIKPCITNMPPHHATRWKATTMQVLAEKLGFKIEKIAFEPLTMNNINYYSEHWVNYRFKNALERKIFYYLTAKFFKVFFKILELFNLKSTNLWHGQSFYVLMIQLKNNE